MRHICEQVLLKNIENELLLYKIVVLIHQTVC